MLRFQMFSDEKNLCLVKLMVWDTHQIRPTRRLKRIEAYPVSSISARDPLATRAVGQDEGSHAKLPQIISPGFAQRSRYSMGQARKNV